MKHITPHQMIAFCDELAMEKEAGYISDVLKRGYHALSSSPRLRQAVGYGSSLLPTSYGRQLMLGAGAGAVGGGVAAEEGEGVRGALRGAMLGAGLAGGRILATQKGRQAAKRGLSNLYERQRYGITGRFGSGVGTSKKQQLAHAEKIGLVPKSVRPEQFAEVPETPGLLERARAGISGRQAVGAREKAITKAKEHRREAVKAFHSGYMSAPGVVHGMLTSPRDVIRGAWKRSGPVGKTFAGLGAYETVKGMAEKPEEGGPGRLEKSLRGAGSTVGWLVAPQTLIGAQLVGSAGGAVGKTVGRLGDVGVRAIKGSGTQPQYYPEGGE